jgi:hypothetical protein
MTGDFQGWTGSGWLFIAPLVLRIYIESPELSLRFIGVPGN